MSMVGNVCKNEIRNLSHPMGLWCENEYPVAGGCVAGGREWLPRRRRGK